MKYTINLTISGEVRERLVSCIRKLRYLAKRLRNGLQSKHLWQVHIPVPKQYIHRAHFTVQIPNQQQQFDVAYMPHDLLPGKYLQVHLNWC